MTFNQLDLPPALREHLRTLGYVEPTPVQQQAIPIAMQGDDLIAIAPTGSGKTLAYALPLLIQLQRPAKTPQALVIVPTRELSEQVAQRFQEIMRFLPNVRTLSLTGGSALRAQADALGAGVDIIVATPGRLIDHLGKGSFDLEHIRFVVLDEADRMLDMGFWDEVQYILSKLPAQRQTLLFSATMPQKIETAAQALMRQPVKIEPDIAAQQPDIRQYYYHADDKKSALLQVLCHFDAKSAIVFAVTKSMVQELTRFLQSEGFDAVDLQGDLNQQQRRERLIVFESGAARVLVATDLAARGLDMPAVDLVINYEMPQIDGHYTHRIGRTGRAGRSGTAVSFVRQLDGARQLTLPEDQLCEPLKAHKHMLVILGGKKQKLRAGDIVGTLIKSVGIPHEAIGKITVLQEISYVAIEDTFFDQAYEGMKLAKIKKRSFRIKAL